MHPRHTSQIAAFSGQSYSFGINIGVGIPALNRMASTEAHQPYQPPVAWLNRSRSRSGSSGRREINAWRIGDTATAERHSSQSDHSIRRRRRRNNGGIVGRIDTLNISLTNDGRDHLTHVVRRRNARLRPNHAARSRSRSRGHLTRDRGSRPRGPQFLIERSNAAVLSQHDAQTNRATAGTGQTIVEEHINHSNQTVALSI